MKVLTNESSCPGKAVARNCSADQVKLSHHMKSHWEKISFVPDTEDLNEVDDLAEDNIQVGRTERPPKPVFQGKSSSIYISGFKQDALDKDIFDKLVEAGLPADHNPEDTNRNRQTGKVYIYKIEPAVTLEIIKNLNGQKISGRNIIVTPIVDMGSPSPSPLSPVRDSGTVPAVPQPLGQQQPPGLDHSDDEEEEDIISDDEGTETRRSAGRSNFFVYGSRQMVVDGW